MKHGRDVPFRFEPSRRNRPARYVGSCSSCVAEYSVGASKWLPDEVVIAKLEQQGMVGVGHGSKTSPRYLLCPSCAGVEGDMSKASGEANVLFDTLPENPESLRVRMVRKSHKLEELRFALPLGFGDLIENRGLSLGVRLVAVNDGGIRIKIKQVEKGEITRGGSRGLVSDNATRWYLLRMAGGVRRPNILVTQNVITALLGVELRSGLSVDQYIPLRRVSGREYREEGKPAIVYACEGMREKLGVVQADKEEEQPASTAQTTPVESAPASAAQPESAAPEQGMTKEEVASAFSVEDSMQVLHKTLENANLHIMNLQDKGWQPEVIVTEDGLIRLKLSKTLF